jgi:hypothetical protein
MHFQEAGAPYMQRGESFPEAPNEQNILHVVGTAKAEHVS